MIRLLAALILSSLPALAEENIVAGMSQNRVSITADFDGSEILIYGAVKRETPAPVGRGALEVIVTVEGPSTPVTVRRKARVAVLSDSAATPAAPSKTSPRFSNSRPR